MNCKHCGKELMEGAKFCVYCGKPIELEEPKIIKPEQKEETVQEANSSISDPFGIMDHKKEEMPAQSDEPSVSVQENPVKTEPMIEEQTKEETHVVDPFEVLDKKKVEPLQPIDEVKKETIEETQTTIEQSSQPEPTPIELPKEPPKQEPNIETKVVKKNNPILIVVIVVLLAIIIGGGFFVYTKYIAPSDNKKSSNQTTPTNNEVTEKDYDKEEAKELIDMYYYTGSSPDINLFTEEMTDSYKKYIATKNLSVSDLQTITCEGLDGFSKDESGICRSNNDPSTTTNGKMVGYDVLNKEYQYLFGKTEEIGKQDFEVLLTTWKYDSTKDSFIAYNKVGGFISGPYFSTYGIQNAKVNGETLTINVGYVFLKPDDAVKISDEEVSFTETEIQKEGFEKEFQEKYLDKLDTYRFTFKYEDDHYVFVDMKKV